MGKVAKPNEPKKSSTKHSKSGKGKKKSDNKDKKTRRPQKTVGIKELIRKEENKNDNKEKVIDPEEVLGQQTWSSLLDGSFNGVFDKDVYIGLLKSQEKRSAPEMREFYESSVIELMKTPAHELNKFYSHVLENNHQSNKDVHFKFIQNIKTFNSTGYITRERQLLAIKCFRAQKIKTFSLLYANLLLKAAEHRTDKDKLKRFFEDANAYVRKIGATMAGMDVLCEHILETKFIFEDNLLCFGPASAIRSNEVSLSECLVAKNVEKVPGSTEALFLARRFREHRVEEYVKKLKEEKVNVEEIEKFNNAFTQFEDIYHKYRGKQIFEENIQFGRFSRRVLNDFLNDLSNKSPKPVLDQSLLNSVPDTTPLVPNQNQESSDGTSNPGTDETQQFIFDMFGHISGSDNDESIGDIEFENKIDKNVSQTFTENSKTELENIIDTGIPKVSLSQTPTTSFSSPFNENFGNEANPKEQENSASELSHNNAADHDPCNENPVPEANPKEQENASSESFQNDAADLMKINYDIQVGGDFEDDVLE